MHFKPLYQMDVICVTSCSGKSGPEKKQRFYLNRFQDRSGCCEEKNVSVSVAKKKPDFPAIQFNPAFLI